ncbi:hypothetical protein [Bordetella bronchialis]|uniref:FAD-binding PCMH-type domain-containing protein n=1 Tax=Bordetella bronchialis TaxID=463025 RepID=A0A193FEV6_9BORD|nr:hypothetical protein [Bordetella bronchialis]ANN65716.1 hypothetical protein BAU06_04890 [Bordetella bronchialis]ANN70746.1 hypothetical protein BAU08_04860 [Bordetella bronchialis]
MQPSRRAFLLGRSTPRTPWQAFCHSLRRACDGELKLLPASDPDGQGSRMPAGASQAPQARWTPRTAADVRQARALCAEHGVQLALADSAAAVEGRPVLWVDPRRLDALVRETGARARWRAGPGVTLGALAQAGLRQFAGQEAGRTVAAWLADRHAAAWPAGRADLSGIYAADVLLADGVADTLGPFGADDGWPLRSAALQQLVPTLFRLASGPEAQWCAAQSAWPARYRLDALLPVPPASTNLARMLHGHGGTLAWLESLILEVPPAGRIAAHGDHAGDAAPAEDSETTRLPPGLPPAQARALDRRIKDSFDPAGLFPEPF